MLPRVAYVHLNLVSLAGVDGALLAQGRASRKLEGPGIDLHVLGDRDGVEDGVRFVRLRTVGPRWTARWQRRLFKYALLSQLDAFRSYDIVVMRYVVAVDLAPLLLFARTQARVVTVHHTKEREELLSGGRTPAARVRAWLEAVQSPRILERVHGVVGVTDEIRDYELSKLRRRKPAATVSNGVDVAQVAPTGFAPIGSELQVAFVASAGAPWHGVDRLIRSLDAYRGKRPIRVHMIGSVRSDSGSLAGGRVTVSHHGVLQGDPMNRVLQQCTIGISSLAMFRNGLQQGAVLKTREYMARGLPFVYGYEDVDVPAEAPFALRVPNTEKNIDVGQIVDFAEAVSALPDLAREMRAWAVRTVDWSVKLRLLQQFAAGLI